MNRKTTGLIIALSLALLIPPSLTAQGQVNLSKSPVGAHIWRVNQFAYPH